MKNPQADFPARRPTSGSGEAMLTELGEEVLKNGMEAKLREFVEKSAEVYAKV